MKCRGCSRQIQFGEYIVSLKTNFKTYSTSGKSRFVQVNFCANNVCIEKGIKSKQIYKEYGLLYPNFEGYVHDPNQHIEGILLPGIVLR